MLAALALAGAFLTIGLHFIPRRKLSQGFGVGNGVPSNSVAHALNESFAIPATATGLALMIVVGLVLIGAITSLDFIWLLADVMNALMAIPNPIALVLLSPIIFSPTREYRARRP
ncbi:MAG: sodium:alanine symporter family protein [Gammaproteobacteria bacterium]|nr:sodium:alanine symporter family protein [Gammaproteobacteria bacterium]